MNRVFVLLVLVACSGSPSSSDVVVPQSLGPAAMSQQPVLDIEISYRPDLDNNIHVRYINTAEEALVHVFADRVLFKKEFPPTPNWHELMFDIDCVRNRDIKVVAELVTSRRGVVKQVDTSVPECHGGTPPDPSPSPSPNPNPSPSPSPSPNPGPPAPSPPPVEKEEPEGLVHYFQNHGKDAMGGWSIGYYFRVKNCSAHVEVADSEGWVPVFEDSTAPVWIDKQLYHKCEGSGPYKLWAKALMTCPGGNGPEHVSDAYFELDCSR